MTKKTKKEVVAISPSVELNLNPPELRDIDTIYPYPGNAKKHDDKSTKKLAESIRRFGWRGNPILVDRDGVIIAGHGRRLAGIALGLKKVPVSVEKDLSAEQARALRLADNRVAMTDFDGDLLERELSDFPDLAIDLDGIFDKKELDFAITDLMETDESVFEDDLSGAVRDQMNQLDERIEGAGAKRITIAKLLGFKSVPGDNAIYVTRLMAHIEASTGMTGEDAFVQYAREQLESA